MSSAGRSLFLFGIYTAAVGIGLLLLPDTMLGVFGIPTTNEVWIRVVGLLISLLGFYYIMAGRKDLTEFIRLSVYGRAVVIVPYIVFIALGFVQPIVIVFGIVDLLGAIWTSLELRSA